MAKEKKQVKEQKDEAEKFKEMLEKQKSLKVEFVLWRLFQLEKDISEAETEIEALNASLTEKKTKFTQLEARITDKGSLLPITSPHLIYSLTHPCYAVE
jgi:structural maintenance of chromosome 1